MVVKNASDPHITSASFRAVTGRERLAHLDMFFRGADQSKLKKTCPNRREPELSAANLLPHASLEEEFSCRKKAL
jgi:hypothetical protein